MLLFILAVDPLLCMLDRHLSGIRCGKGEQGVSVVAYADDLTLLLSDGEEINMALDIIGTYEKETGARLNLRKSKALTVGAWDTSIRGMEIPYYQDITTWCPLREHSS
jgi:hypothetical protein